MNNVIIGEKAVVLLLHDEEKKIVFDAIQEHPRAGEFVSILNDVATKNLTEVGKLRAERLKGLPNTVRDIFEWKRDDKGGLRLYTKHTSVNGKPVYIILWIGNKTSQMGDVKIARNKYTLLEKKIKDGTFNIEQEIAAAEKEARQQKSVKVISHYYGDWRDYQEKRVSDDFARRKEA